MNNQFLADLESELLNNEKQGKIHLRVQQRTTRKRITIVEGIQSLEIELPKLLNRLKKTFSCNGCIKNIEDEKLVMQLSGDQRENVKNFLVKNELIRKENIVVHGY